MSKSGFNIEDLADDLSRYDIYNVKNLKSESETQDSSKVIEANSKIEEEDNNDKVVTQVEGQGNNEVTISDKQEALTTDFKVVESKSPSKPKKKKQTKKLKSPVKGNKWEELNAITARVSDDQLKSLKDMEFFIMRNRSKDDSVNRERITVNSILRAAISNLIDHSDKVDLTGIQNEEILQERLQTLFK